MSEKITLKCLMCKFRKDITLEQLKDIKNQFCTNCFSPMTIEKVEIKRERQAR